MPGREDRQGRRRGARLRFARQRERHARLDGQPGAVEAASPRIADREAAERGRRCIADDHPALVDLVAGRGIEILHGHRELPGRADRREPARAVGFGRREDRGQRAGLRSGFEHRRHVALELLARVEPSERQQVRRRRARRWRSRPPPRGTTRPGSGGAASRSGWVRVPAALRRAPGRRDGCRRGSRARGKIVGRGGEDPALQGGRRLDGLEGLGQRRHHRTQLGELLVRQRTRAEVLANRLLLVGLERVQHERGGQLDRLLVGQSRPVVHGPTPCSRRWRRIASSASRIRPLTVPSGAPVLVAISCCVSPPK